MITMLRKGNAFYTSIPIAFGS